MKRFLAVLLSLGASLSLSAISRAEETLTLKVADSYPPGHFLSEQGAKPWMARVAELTGGKVQFQYYPAEQLGKLFDLPTLLEGGIADVVLVASGLLPGDYPLASGLPALAGKASNVKQVTDAYWSLLATDGPVRAEYTSKGMHPLFFYALPQFEIVSTKKPVAKHQDFRGLKVRSGAGLQAEIVGALGATAVQLTPNDTYSALERGTVDAAMMPYPSAKSYKLEEVTKYATFGAALGTTIVGYAMTEEQWGKLTPDTQKAFMQASDEAMARISDYQDKTTLAYKEQLKGKGITVTDIIEDEVKRWGEATQSVTESWLKAAEAKNLPARETYAAWTKALGEGKK
jgi:TRAP-type C4-dicarboxylate transport system substrate-binding protein